MAAPHVSGTAALVASVFPSLAADPAALKARLLATGKPDAATTGLTVTGRVVDAFRSLDTVGPLAQGPVELRVRLWARRWAAPRSRPVSAGRAPPTIAAAWPRTGCRQQAGAGSWVTAVGSTTARSATRTLTFGHDVRLPRPRP